MLANIQNFFMNVHIFLGSSQKIPIINPCLEQFLGINLCFCNKEFVENILRLEKY
jgi:hypothetical protein